MAMYPLDCRTVILSGASGGFGAELTKILIKKFNCNVIGIGRDREKMNSLVSSLGEYRDHFKYYLFDVSVKENWIRLAKTLRGKGVCPELLINNAGIMPPFEKFVTEGSDGIIRVMNVNFMSAVYSCEALLPMLKASQIGGIVNIASSAAFSPIIGTAAYSASKGALKNFTQALAQELDGEIYVGLVCPGLSRTTLFRDTELTDLDKKLFDTIGSDRKIIASQIATGIYLGRKLIIAGKDAKIMTAMSAAAPSAAPSLFGKIIKESGLDVFEGLQDDEDGESL